MRRIRCRPPLQDAVENLRSGRLGECFQFLEGVLGGGLAADRQVAAHKTSFFGPGSSAQWLAM